MAPPDALTRRLLDAVRAQHRRHGLWSPGERILVAVSGGGDSLALLGLLAELAPEEGFALAVAHADHGWRADSGADAAFVAALAERLGLPCHLAGPPAWPAGNREAAARAWRQRWWGELVAAGHGDRVATGHTRDDQAETVMLRLLAGAAPEALAGIAPCRRLAGRGSPWLIRPLLGIGRGELREWLTARGQSWREDAGNQRLDRARNRVRHSALPWLALEFNPQLSRHLAQLAALAWDDQAYWARRLRRLRGRWGWEDGVWAIELRQLWPLPLALRRRLLHYGLRRAGMRRPGYRLLEQLVEWVGEPPPAPRPAHPRHYVEAGARLTVTARRLEIEPRHGGEIEASAL